MSKLISKLTLLSLFLLHFGCADQKSSVIEGGPNVLKIELGGENKASAKVRLEIKCEGEIIWNKNITAPGEINLKAITDTVFDGLDTKEECFLYFKSDEYAGQWRAFQKSDLSNDLVLKDKSNVVLYKKQYAIIEYEFYEGDNTFFKNRTPTTKGVAAVGHWGSLPYFYQDWQVWQASFDNKFGFGNKLILCHHRGGEDMGFKEAHYTKFDNMLIAPTSNYSESDFTKKIYLQKGKLYYCKVVGDRGVGKGCGKILIRGITHQIPKGMQVFDENNS